MSTIQAAGNSIDEGVKAEEMPGLLAVPQRSDKVIDPLGDIVLVVGKSDSELRVSSAVLRLASSVFAAMVKPHFAEGRELAEAGSARIRLPDDDEAAMSLLCEALHYQKELSAACELGMLCMVAMLCDKYGLTSAFKSWGQVICERECGQERSHSACSISQGLFIAHTFNNREAFFAASKGVFSRVLEIVPRERGSKATLTAPPKFVAVNYVHQQIYDKIIESRKRAKDSAILDLAFFASKMPHGSTSKERLAATYLHHFSRMNSIGLHPLTSKTQRLDIGNLLERIFRYGKCDQPSTECCCSTKFMGPGSASAYLEMYFLRMKYWDETFGLCLTCVKQGRFDKEAGNCRSMEKCTHGEEPPTKKRKTQR